jgi:hypothetical protein
MMSPRADTADARGYPWHFLHRPTLTKLLKAPELRYLQIGISDIALVVKEDLYLAVSFKPGYGINGDLLH